MDIRSLNTFIHVAELGSFSRAGERLGYSQPTVSVQIKQLEESLGFRLFDRIGHTIRLTDQGRLILARAQEICRLSQQMTHNQEAPRHTVIRLATADSLCVPLMEHTLPYLRQQHPEIAIELTTAGTNDLFRLLDQNEADIVCTLDSHIYNTNYIIAAEQRIGLHFVVSASHPLAEKKDLQIADLMQQEMLLTERGMSYRRLLDEWLAKHNVELKPVLETGRADLLCQFAEQGMGMSFLPDYVTEEGVTKGTLVRLDAEGFAPELWKQLLYHRDKWVSTSMEAVIHCLK